MDRAGRQWLKWSCALPSADECCASKPRIFGHPQCTERDAKRLCSDLTSCSMFQAPPVPALPLPPLMVSLSNHEAPPKNFSPPSPTSRIILSPPARETGANDHRDRSGAKGAILAGGAGSCRFRSGGTGPVTAEPAFRSAGKAARCRAGGRAPAGSFPEPFAPA